MVRLNPVAADDAPASFFDQFTDSLEQFWVCVFEMVVEVGFASIERQIGEIVQKLDHGTACPQAFIESFLPIPVPDRIQMRIRQEMNCFHG